MNTHDPQGVETKAGQSSYLAPYNEGFSLQIEALLSTLNATDRALVEEAHVFLLSGDQNDFSQIKLHGDNVGAVIAYGVSDPRLGCMLGKLMAVLCEHHITAAEAGLKADVKDFAAVKHALVLALDAAKSLKHPKGYNDATHYRKVLELLSQLSVNDVDVAGIRTAVDESIRKIAETR